MVRLERYAGDKANAHKVTLGHLEVWFSYETPIAYDDGEEFVCSENPAGPTTGRHINVAAAPYNECPQIPQDEFLRKLDAAARRGQP
jgi:hypothetical protein